ncbi:BREX-1 system adenine-specific DNA-methyltransferase PglX [Maridesulfovibrio sp.]|uniref:BREX-1 system adenine-specific DNA-methyltransferase PglX n=1 Tax=unclassified Maridesulfovibrio TaxID=2794999 RepID=UPI003AFF7F73
MPINKSILKSYAPQARKDFIQAVTDKASLLGLSEDSIEPMEIKGELAIIAGRPFPKSIAEQRKKLEARIKQKGFGQVMDEIAYTWFNRFTALRYMELHDYLGHGYRVLSNPSGSDIPEILEKATSVDLPGLDMSEVAELRLAGDKDAELYRLLLIKQCNALHKVMPMMFESVNGASELLLPENILQSDSPIRKMVNEIPEENWDEIEVVGWLYQFYIIERRKEVFGTVVASKDIPAATQLFTPNWIVKYMVQNTLGNKWLMTYPESSLKDKMEFYIAPAKQEPEVQEQLDSITAAEINPEELTFMDPACGSGHILAEAYDLFKEIYLERGYRTREIPRLILEKNLHGLDIDDRAAQLARFTVLMKARGDNRRILDPENPVQLNIMSIQESKDLDVDEIANVLLRERVKETGEKGQQQMSLLQTKPEQASLHEVEKSDVSKEELYSLIHLFEESKTFGSLLTVHDKLKESLPKLEKLIQGGLEGLDMDTRRLAEALLPLVKQVGLLGRLYDFVVANPPYMGNRGINPKLKKFAKSEYPKSKTDLFAMFMERCLEMVKEGSSSALITMQSWMFLSSYEDLRMEILNNTPLHSMLHLGPGMFDHFEKKISQHTCFVLLKIGINKYKGPFFDLTDGRDEKTKKDLFIERINKAYFASSSNFKKIPGRPIVYWVSEPHLNAFSTAQKISESAQPVVGLQTGDNDKFIRFWFEVTFKKVGFGHNTSIDALLSRKKWFPYTKGGNFRKWYGNNYWVVNWENDGQEIKGLDGSYPRNMKHYFQEGLSYTNISNGKFSSRFTPTGFIFDQKGSMFFSKERDEIKKVAIFLHSKCGESFLKAMCPTLDFNPGTLSNLPLLSSVKEYVEPHFTNAVSITKKDWDLYEYSWDFQRSPLLTEKRNSLIFNSYKQLSIDAKNISQELCNIEKEINISLIKIYNLQEQLTPEVSIYETTLNANPYHRYGPNKTEEEYETLQRTDTIKELISYAIGCMMGRYSLDEEGLIYAHSNNEGFDPSRYTTFPADEDGIVPVMDEGYFADDATNRFKEFLKVAWSPETLDENLKFVADSLEPKKGEEPIDTIRRFISQKFFKTQHLKVYKKRPIYWLFSSGKQKAFECLVYLHRYNENTLSRMRAMYVTPLQGKYNARIEYLDKEKDNASSTSAAKKIQKELDKMRKKQQELREYDELLRHYADQKITLDLDDGVKVNYGKFGKLLAEVKAVTGKNPE